MENPEGVGPVVELLVGFVFGKITGAISALGKEKPGESSETTGGALSLVKHARDISKELIGAVKGHTGNSLKASTGDHTKDAKLDLLDAILPIVENERKAIKRAVMQMRDAELVQIAEHVAALDVSKPTFAARIDETLGRFKAQVLSIGQGNHLSGTAVAWVFRADGERRLASVAMGRETMRYRGEDYDARSGEWEFLRWLDSDMMDPAIDRAYANKREIVDLKAPGAGVRNPFAATQWTNPDAPDLAAWAGQ
jgi:hypothetical protein